MSQRFRGNIFQTLDRLEKIRRQEITFDKDADVYTYDVHDDSILCVLREYKGRRFFWNIQLQQSGEKRREEGGRRGVSYFVDGGKDKIERYKIKWI